MQIGIDAIFDKLPIPNEPIEILGKIGFGNKENQPKKNSRHQKELKVPFFKLDDFVAEKEQPAEEGQQFYIVGTVQVIGKTGIEKHTPDDKEYRVFMQTPVR